MKTQLIPFHKAAMTTIAAALAVSAVGCGTKTNPTEGYQDVTTGAVAPYQQVEFDQNVLVTAPVSLEEVGTNLVWQVGVEKVVPINPSMLIEGTEYEMAAQGLPEGMELVRASSGYALKWKPTQADLGQNPHKSFPVKLEVQATKVPRVRNAEAFTKGTVFRRMVEVVLVQNGAQPTFQSVALSSKIIEEGGSVTIQVKVKDPGGSSNYEPQLNILEDRKASTEGGLIQAKPFIGKISSKSLGGDVYQFDLVLSTAGMTMPANNEPIVPVRFEMSIESATLMRSDRKTVEVQVRRKRAAPQASAPAPAPAPAANPAAPKPATPEVKPATSNAAARN